MSSNVVNPTNAPHDPRTALPFSSTKHLSAVAKNKAKPDAFNTGGDYPDEGLPLMESEINPVKLPVKPAFRMVPGLINPPSVAEIAAFSHMDESAQGSHINYLQQGIIVDVDAKLITSSVEEMRKGKFREAHYPTMEDWMHSDFCRRLRESNLRMRNVVEVAKKSVFDNGKKGIILSPLIAQQFRSMDEKISKRLREAAQKDKANGGKKLREGIDSFAQDDITTGFGTNISSSFDSGSGIMSPVGRDTEFIPLLAGPFNKQLYWADYLDMHSKAFEAWTHNPLAKRICKVITQFVLGKGVKATVVNAELPTGKTEKDQQTGEEFDLVADLRQECQDILDEHWSKNNLAIRAKQILRDLLIFGEQFVRYFDAPWGLKVRGLDPSTVWEVVTDPDDAETIFYLHQQYPTKYQWFVDLPIPTIKFIIRQVPSALFYHMKINTVAGEVRGRSELFAILGWLKRLKEFATDRVIRNKMGNLFVLDVAVEGGPEAVTAMQAQFNQPPTPGSFFIHNKAAELQGVKAEIGAGDVTPDWDMLLTVLAAGTGVSKEYLGLAQAGSKAQALVGTEPDIKTFEDYQEITEQFLLHDAKRCFERAKEMGKIPDGVTIKVEITFPTMAEENRSEKLKDIAFMESMSWITHRRASSMAAKEMQVTSYEYDEEQEEVMKEDAEAQIKFNAAYVQALKGQAEPPKGAGQDAGGGAGGKAASGMGMGTNGGGAPPSPPGGKTESKKWGRTDPRITAESLMREATNLLIKKKPINRRRYAMMTPDRTRDQKSLDREDIITKGKRAVRGDYNEGEKFPKLTRHVSDTEIIAKEGGPGSGPHKAGDLVLYKGRSYRVEEKDPDGEHYWILMKSGASRGYLGKVHEKHLKPDPNDPRRLHRSEAEEGMEPFKPQDGELLQDPPVSTTTDSPAHTRKRKKPMPLTPRPLPEK